MTYNIAIGLFVIGLFYFQEDYVRNYARKNEAPLQGRGA